MSFIYGKESKEKKQAYTLCFYFKKNIWQELHKKVKMTKLFALEFYFILREQILMHYI